MSDREDIELQALQRQLDDAFETTRPRRGFEDELWLRVQTHRPFLVRIQDGFAGLFRAVREAPAVPAAAIAALLVVAIGVGIVRLGAGGAGGAGSTTNLAQGGSAYGPVAQPYRPQTAFGPLPGPAVPRLVGPAPVPRASTGYAGPVALTWAGQLNLGITSAPVFRYFEPAAATADQLATSLGVASVSPAAGDLGTYASPALHLQVRGTIQSPPLEPFFYVVSSGQAPAASGAAADIAGSYLAALSLAPAWPYTVATAIAGDVTEVRYLRQFDVPTYGPASVVDGNGERYGIDVDVKGGRVVSVAGPLSLGLDSANYPIISADRAVSMALASASGTAGAAGVPTAQLNKAELVYVLVVAGDHSFYEPAVLFSGTLSADGLTLTERVLVPAIDPSQLTR